MKHQKARMIIIIFWDPFDALFFNIFSRNKQNPDKNTNLPSSPGTFPNHLALTNQGPILEIRSLQNHHNVSIICVSTQKPYQRAHLSAIFTKKELIFFFFTTAAAGHPCLKTRSSGFSIKCALISTLILSWGLGSFEFLWRILQRLPLELER